MTQFVNLSGAYLERWTLWNRLLLKGVRLWAGTKNVDSAFSTLLRDSDRIIVLSDMHRIRVSEILPGADKKCVLIPPPPLISKIPWNGGLARKKGRKSLGVQGNDFVVVYFGRI